MSDFLLSYLICLVYCWIEFIYVYRYDIHKGYTTKLADAGPFIFALVPFVNVAKT
jgi:hypothetical protein